MKYCALLTVLFTSYIIQAQKTWNHRVLIPGNTTTNHRVVGTSFHEGKILISGSTNIVEINENGEITGDADLPSYNLYYNFISKMVEPQSGKVFFVAGGRGIAFSSSDYRLQVIESGVGIRSEIILPDTTSALSSMAPLVIEYNDSMLVVFCQKKIYGVRRNGVAPLLKVWEKNMPAFQGKIRAAISTSNGFIACTNAGEVAGFDTQGQSIFTVQHDARAYQSAKMSNDGILACGTSSDNRALLAKMNLQGQLLWTKQYEMGDFYDLSIDFQGYIYCTGQRADKTIWLQKLNELGLAIWGKSYQPGKGIRLLRFNNGNLAIVGIEHPQFSRLDVICTNTSGDTQPLNPNIYSTSRPITTEGFQSFFEPFSSLFFDGSNASLFTPFDSGTATIYAFTPWLAGKSPDGQYCLLAENYYSATVLQSGFFGGKTGEFSRVWRTSRNEIWELRNDFLADGALDQSVPYDILTWPGKGNLYSKYNINFTLVETNPQFFSAPFVDWNGDGRYNVYDGDYPAIKGDQMVWWVLNDSVPHSNSDALPVGVEISFSVYAYDCPLNENLKNTLMADIQIINRSDVEYDSAYMSWFIDFDMGCPEDDFMGTMPDENCVFAYNQDAFDNNDCEYPGFKDHIPVQTVTFSNHNLDRCMYFNNNINNPAPATTDPQTPEERINYMQGRWKNGIPLTPGGSGYNPSSSIPADFVFPANPADPSGWNMCNANLPYGDRRMLPSKGPFTFGANDTLHTTVVFTTHHNIPHPCPDVFGLVKPAVQNISAWTNGGVMDQIPDLGAVQFLPQGQALNLTPGNFPGATYAWSTGANTPGISVTQPGQYAVTVTTEAGCAYTDAVEVLNPQSGVHAPADAPAWSISPNPASDAVTVRCADCQGLWRACLRNAMGAQVAENRSVEFGKPWSLQGLPAGVYWVELWQEGRPGWGRQLVVVR